MKKIVLSALIGLIAFSTSSFAADVDTKLVNVSLFKNGLGYFVWEASFKKPKNDSVTLGNLPTPILGTFWITSPDPAVKIESALAYRADTPKQLNAINIEEFLKANIGKKVEIKTYDKQFIGTILDVPDNRKPENTDPSYPQPYDAGNIANIVIIQTDDNVVVLYKSDIKEIKFKEKPNYIFTQSSTQPILKLKVNTNLDKNKVYLSYLQRGITWVPSYAIDISNENDAMFSMKALIVNDVEDLSNAKVEFITGFPHIGFSHVTSPLALRDNLATFLSSINRRASDNDGIMAQQMITSNMMPLGGTEESVLPDYESQEGEGQVNEDLFFYDYKDISLKKGERGYYPLFTNKIKYKHIYDCDINELTKSYEPTAKSSRDVWHSLILTNSTKQPWTTGTAMVVSKNRILGQDTLYYTPQGVTATLKITKATDIKIENKEIEVDRKSSPKMISKLFDKDNYNYKLVTVKGEINIVNYKNKDVDIRIVKNIKGDASNVSHKGKINVLTEDMTALNKNTDIKWEIPLKQKEKTTITYTYNKFIW